MPEIKFKCSNCGQSIACDAGAAGSVFACPDCRKELVVPGAPAEAAQVPELEPRDIFISYRREGGENLARLVMKALVRRGFSVFMDTEGLTHGQFDIAILRHIELAKDVLVICSPGALDRCVDKEVNQEDWVRQEISHAFLKGKNVVRLTDPSFRMPPKAAMPAEIAQLADSAALSSVSGSWDATIERLAGEYLESEPDPEKRQVDEVSAEGRALAWDRLRAMLAGGIAGIVLLMALVSVPAAWNHALNIRFHRLGRISKETVCVGIICTLVILAGARLSYLANRLGPWLILGGSVVLMVANLVLCYYHLKALRPLLDYYHQAPTRYYFQWAVTIVPFMALTFLYRKGK